MTIVEFLLARIAEDESAAQRAQAVTAAEWVANGSVLMHIADPATRLAEATALVEDYRMDDAWRHAERHDPARVLAECKAKRAIIECETQAWTFNPPSGVQVEYNRVRGDVVFLDGRPIDRAEGERLMAQWSRPIMDTPTLRILAAVYADHPDHREEWRP